MKILMIVFNQVGRGTYYRALALGQELAVHNHEITLLATAPKERLRFTETIIGDIRLVESPDLTRGSLRSGWDPWNVFRRSTWAGKNTFDLVHAFETRPTVIYPALKIHRRGVPIFMDWADWFGKGGSVEERKNPVVRTILRPVETFYEEHFRGVAQGTTVISRSIYQRAINLGVPENRLLILPNGANVKVFYPVNQRHARDVFGITEDAPIIGYMGSIFMQDAQFMSESFNLVQQRIPTAKLMIAGYCPFDFTKQVSRPESVIVTGSRTLDKLNTALNCCDILWLPLKNSQANRGRLPLKASDYLAVGKPIISTDVGDLREFLENGDFGAVVPDSIDLFARATIDLLADPHQRKAFGEKARQYAVDHLRWSHLAQKLEEFYEQSLSGK